MISREEIFRKIKDTLVAEFDIAPDAVTEKARFFEDLDLDSIDAVDLVVRLKNETGLRMTADDFKAIRTLGDLLDVLARLAAEQAPKA